MPRTSYLLIDAATAGPLVKRRKSLEAVATQKIWLEDDYYDASSLHYTIRSFIKAAYGNKPNVIFKDIHNYYAFKMQTIAPTGQIGRSFTIRVSEDREI